MDEWKDPCKTALTNVNKRIYDAKGNRRIMAAQSFIDTGGASTDGLVAERDRQLSELNLEVKRLKEIIIRQERQLARQVLVEKIEKEVCEVATKPE